jgi:uncharacterized repeat protein (TIGR03803 family)
VLWNFSCFGDGKNPHGGVTLHNGALYGTTVAGGAGGICAGDGCGVVFKLVPGVTLHVLYNFRGGNDGFGPGGAVAFDRAGNLYGTTPDGGVYQHGTVYELNHLSGGGYRYAIIHNFTGGSDGATGSLGALLVDASGDLFGVTETGGPHGAGTAYEMTPQSGGAWHFTTIYPFSGAPNAGFPYGGLVADANGNLYGTTYYAGKFGFGSVFELSPTATTPWKERLLHSFKAGSDGSSPTSTPAFDPKGNLFGTTSAGGTTSCDCGTVFRIDRTTGNESIVHVFGASGDGSYPYYGLTAYGSRFYSSTVAGGLYGQGTIFSVAQ